MNIDWDAAWTAFILTVFLAALGQGLWHLGRGGFWLGRAAGRKLGRWRFRK